MSLSNLDSLSSCIGTVVEVGDNPNLGPEEWLEKLLLLRKSLKYSY